MRCAINKKLINKSTTEMLKIHSSSFENFDLNANELKQAISNGYAFCAELTGNRRSGKNFQCSGFLAVDIDHGLTLDAAKENDFVKSKASFLYTTPSHTDEFNRFRIVFELEEVIDDKEEMRNALTGLIIRLGGDQACKDPSRLFYGSKDCLILDFGKTLSKKDVTELCERAKETLESKGFNNSNGLTKPILRSSKKIDSETIIQAADGSTFQMKDAPIKVSVFCPMHADEKPSAFTTRNRFNVPCISCSKCSATFFMDHPFEKLFNYNFDYGLDRIKNPSVEEYLMYSNDDGGYDISEIRQGEIQILDERHLQYLDGSHYKSNEFDQFNDMVRDIFQPSELIKPKITFIKSQKGTGKTEWLKEMVSDCKKRNLSVLLVGHRRSLINSTSERIGVCSYLKINDDEYADLDFDVKRYFATCIDSLIHLNPAIEKYDVIIIDESEQVYSHLISNTLIQNRKNVLRTLKHYIDVSKEVYLLDADLGRLTIEITTEMHDDPQQNYRLIINEWKPDNRFITISDSSKPDHLIGDLVNSINLGKRCYACSNSKDFVKKLSKQLSDSVERSIKIMCITSDNSQAEETQKFLHDIKVSALEYDVILTSPAVGTGIDISFNNDEALIQSVYGFFFDGINTHFDIDQQLSRVRNPGEVKVWVSSNEFNFECDPEVIQIEVEHYQEMTKDFVGINKDGSRVFSNDPLYSFVYSHVTALQRASKNKLKHNFIQLRKRNGWNVVVLPHNKELAKEGKRLVTNAKNRKHEEDCESLMKAQKITREKYEELRSQQVLSSSQSCSLRRYEIESFYRADLDEDLFALDNNGRFRDQVRQLENLWISDEKLVEKEKHNSANYKIDSLQLVQKKNALLSIFEHSSLLKNGSFDCEKSIISSELNGFVSYVMTNKVMLERLFNMSVRADLQTKPTLQLKQYLKLVGLDLYKSARDQSGAQSNIKYKLDEADLSLIQELVHKRSK